MDSHTPPFLLSSFSLAEVLGSRWIWLGHVLWSVPMAVTLCIPVFSRLSYFVYTPGCGGWHTFYPGFLLYFDTGHIACVRRASLFWSGACFLLFLPPFPLVSQAALLPSPVLALRVGAGLGFGCLGGCGCYYSRKFFFFLCLCPGFVFQVSILPILLVWFAWGFGMFCLRHGVYLFYGLRDVGGILTFHSFWWLSVVCDNPLSVILTFFAWWFCLSRDLVPCYFGGLVVGALDIFWLDWTLCSFEVLPSR